MKELLLLHVGGAGCRMGEACWDLFAQEASLQKDGSIPNGASSALFEELPTSKARARGIFIDENTTMADLRKNPHHQLFHPDDLIGSNEDSHGLYTVGNYLRKDLVSTAMERCRRQIEAMDGFQGFIKTYGSYGGTGAGLGNALSNRLGEEFGNKACLEFPLFPSRTFSDSVVEPYNHGFWLMDMMEREGSRRCILPMENERLYEQCLVQLGIANPTIHDVNRLIAQHVSHQTMGIRAPQGAPFSMDLAEFVSKLQLDSTRRFMQSSLCPVTKKGTMDELIGTSLNVCGNGVLNVNVGKTMGLIMNYSGNVSCGEMSRSVREIRQNESIKFALNTPFGVHVTYNKANPVFATQTGYKQGTQSIAVTCHNSDIKSTIQRNADNYQKIFNTRAFLHWFVGIGISEDILPAIPETSANIVQSYTEVEQL